MFAARKVGASGRVIAIEPIPVLVDRVRFNAGANGFGQVSIWPNAVGATEGVTTLHVNERQYGTSSVSSHKDARPLQVEIKTLLAILEAEGLQCIDAMKIDVEGHEDRVLLPFFSGAPRHLWPARVFIEHRHARLWHTNVIEHMKASGYAIAWSDQYDSLLKLR